MSGKELDLNPQGTTFMNKTQYIHVKNIKLGDQIIRKINVK